MDEELKSTEQEQKPETGSEPVKKSRSKAGEAILLSLLILLLIGAAAGAAYLWRDKSAKEFEKQQTADISALQQTNASLKKQLADEKAKTTKTATAENQTACAPKSPSASTIENIKASITSGNTAALEGYMASSVNVILAASGGIGAQTPTQAVGDITSFIGDPTSSSWDFALSASVLSSYGKGSYSKYFPSIAVVGKSAAKKVISFSFDCNAKISTVFLAANEALVN